MTFQLTESIFDPEMLFQKAPELQGTEVDIPNPIAGFFKADVLAGAALADVDPVMIPADASVIARISAVLVRVPPQHEFPLHIHPRSEDCFFVISGAGEAFSQDQRFPISEVAGVWIPAGVPHGLAAGALGILEIGFQSPPGPTVEPIDSCAPGNCPYGIVAAPISLEPELSREIPEWRPVFAGRPGWRHLDPQYCFLETSQQLHVVADGCELLVVVARGAVELRDIAGRVSAIAVVQLSAGESEVLHALEANTLLLCIRASAAQIG